MASVASTLGPTPPAASLNENDVYFMLSDPSRRNMLQALRHVPSLPATKLFGLAGLQFDAAVKHLRLMQKAGLLVGTLDPTDKRRTLYGLSPAVSVIKTDTGTAMDFGCCLMVCDGKVQLSGIRPVRQIIEKD